MPDRFKSQFPEFADFVRNTDAAMLEQVLPPTSEASIADLESNLGVPLPVTYKAFLKCARGFWLFGGSVQLSAGHPFFHEFPAYDELTLPARRVVTQRGGKWPPPSEGMLCFAEFFMEADGDQVLFDVRSGLSGGEYPVVYYAHEVPSVRVIASSFSEWLNLMPRYFEGSINSFHDDV